MNAFITKLRERFQGGAKAAALASAPNATAAGFNSTGAVENKNSRVSVDLNGLLALRGPARRLVMRPAQAVSQESGQYRSLFKGRGMEFDEVRLYQPGDDVRALDWRVMARTGKAYTKLFREERERAVLLCVDMRSPMFFATRGSFKSVVAAKCASLLAWSASYHGDRVGAEVFSATDHFEMRPSRGSHGVLRFIRRLNAHPVWQAGAPIQDGVAQPQAATEQQLIDSGEQALSRLRKVARPGSLVFILSDFRYLNEQAEHHLGRLAKHCDVVLVDITDPFEHALPDVGVCHVSDHQSNKVINSHALKQRQQYQQAAELRQSHIKNMVRRYRLAHLSCLTTDDPLEILRAGLRLMK